MTRNMAVVPVEPTEAMIEAYFKACERHGFRAHINASCAWEAMLSAAPLEGQGDQGSSLRDTQPGAADRWADLEALYEAASEGPWEAGHHPAVPRGGSIIRPVTFGSRVRVLPDSEGGHVMIGEADAALIEAMHASLPGLIAAARHQAPVSPAEQVGWRDIATVCPNEQVMIWRPSDFAEDHTFRAVLEDGTWYVHDGKHDHALRGDYPTHWRPLLDDPAPPADRGIG